MPSCHNCGTEISEPSRSCRTACDCELSGSMITSHSAISVNPIEIYVSPKWLLPVFVLCCIIIILTLGGCGGCGDSNTPTATPTPAQKTTQTISQDSVRLQVTFEWVYQPNDTSSFEIDTIGGDVSLMASDNSDASTYDLAGFTFDTREIVHIEEADIYFGNYEGFPNTFWANNGDGGIRDMGVIPLENLANAPMKSIGSGASQYHNEEPVDVIEGHTYCIITKDGDHYAKIRVTAVSPSQIE